MAACKLFLRSYLCEGVAGLHYGCAERTKHLMKPGMEVPTLPRALVVCYCQRFRMKTFTIEEAQSLLPLLESLLKRAIEGKRAAQDVEKRIVELGRRIESSGGMRLDVAAVVKERAEMEGHLQRVRESISEIDSIGVQVKDMDTGLLDFPCKIDDQVVLLCWRMGEGAIEHWHTIEDGFNGRKPLDERFRRRSNSSNRPN